jgi:hypothetical protein
MRFLTSKLTSITLLPHGQLIVMAITAKNASSVTGSGGTLQIGVLEHMRPGSFDDGPKSRSFPNSSLSNEVTRQNLVELG